MSRMRKIALWVLAAAAGLAVALAVAAVLILRSPWFRDKVRERLVYEIERSTGGRAEIGRFDLDWSTLTASVTNLVLHGTEGAGEAPLLQADSVQVTLRVLSLWKKQVDLQSVVVRRPRMNVIVYPDGHSNLPKPKVARQSKRGTLETVLDLAIKRFNLVEGTLHAGLREVPLDLLGEDLRAQIFYDGGPPRYRGEVAFRQLNLTPGERETLPFDLSANWVLERDRLSITSARAALHDSRVDLRGVVENFAAPSARFDYAARVLLKDVPPPFRIAQIPQRGAIALNGQAAASGVGSYRLSGRLQATGLEFVERGIHIRNIGVRSNVSLTPGRLDFRDLTVSALGGRAAGRAEVVHWRDLSASLDLSGFSLDELTRFERSIQRMPWNGTISGPVQVTAVLRRGGAPADVAVRARASITPAEGPNPVEGLVHLSYQRRPESIEFARSYLVTRFSRLQFAGTLGRRLDVSLQSTNLDDAEPGIAMFTTGPPPPLPVRLQKGVAKFQGALLGPLKQPVIQGRASATRLLFEGHTFDEAQADVTVSRTGVAAENVTVMKGGMRGTGAIQIGFRDWKPEADQRLAGTATVRAPDVSALLAEVGQHLPVSGGNVLAEIALSGTVGRPEADARVQGSKLLVWQQPVDSFRGQVAFTEGLLRLTSWQLAAGASRVEVSGSYRYPQTDWRQGEVRAQVSSPGIYLEQLKPVQDRSPGLQGRVEVRLAGDVKLLPGGFRPGAFNGAVVLRDLAVDNEPLGSITLTAASKASALEVRADGELAGAKLTGSSEWTLSGDYPVRGQLSFTPLRFSTLLAKLGRTFAQRETPFEGLVAGQLEFSGSATKPESFQAKLELPQLEIHPAPGVIQPARGPALVLRNAGPVSVDIDSRGVRVRQAVLRGKDTNLTAKGSVAFGVKNSWDVRVQGTVDMALVRDFDNDLLGSGSVALDVSVRGALARPDVYGRIDLKNASVNFANLSNGIDNANGVIFLYRDRATIDNLTAESGGGKLAISGFVGFTGVTTFHLQAKATDVRVRYPEGVSSTANATLNFTGTIDRSVLSGDVTVTRVGFNPRTDLGSILARTAQPVRAPAHPSRFEQGIRLDLRIVTAPQVRFETQLTRDIQADADLRLRGDPTRPILLGRVLINRGEVIFFGNKYTIESGQILFVNSSKIEPTVNLDLETRAGGVDITLHISGPVDKMNVSYRSDPPMQFSDIVALLTTGRETSGTPGLTSSSQQQQLSQSWEQAGASALLSQAIASPIAGRLQRFFGVSRLKISPEITGVTTNNAAARVTLEQQLSPNLSFTYITDLSRAQAQSIRIEWNLSDVWSAVALREENGMFGIDFLYRKQFK